MASENITHHDVQMIGSGEANLVPLTDAQKSASAFFQTHNIKYDFKVETEARKYFVFRDLVAELGGIFASIGLIFGQFGTVLMVQYFWWLGGTYKRLSGHNLNVQAIEEIKTKLKTAKFSDQELQKQIDEALKEDLEEFGYTETENFKTQLQSLFEQAKVLSKVNLDQKPPSHNPIFETDQVIAATKKLEHELLENLQEGNEMPILQHIMEIKETCSLINVIRMNDQLKIQNITL